MMKGQFNSGILERAKQQRSIRSYAWAPIAVVLVGLLLLWAVGPRPAIESPLLLFGLNFIFTTLVSLSVVYVVGRGSVKATEEPLPHLNAQQAAEVREAYETVQRERRRFNDVLEMMPAYVILLSPDYRVPFANRFFEERFGKSNGRRCYEYLFARTEPCENCETFTVLKTQAPHRWEWTGPDGRDYDIHDFPFTDSDGSPLIMEMGIDITERKRAVSEVAEHRDRLGELVRERTLELETANARLQEGIAEHMRAEQAITRAKEEWERTFDSVPDLIAVLDDRHRIVRANRAMAERLNSTPEECAGQACFRCVHGTDGPPGFCPHALTLIDGREHVAEVHEPRLGGDFIVSTTPLLDEDGRSLGSVHVARDITARKRAEEQIHRQNSILQGINRIFEAALTSTTEQDLGQACLTVAEEITGSRFGFIGEIGADGLLHDIAISDPGWEACRVRDSSGQRRPVGGFVIHGIYGRVLLSGQSLITNEPDSHPDTIGVPPGHPPLTAFLGVPLIRAGETVGMVAVANREGGYAEEQREALEALTPVIVEAFSRKRAEDAQRQLAQFPEQNPSPVLRIAADGAQLYVNSAARDWLAGMGGAVDRPLPAAVRALIDEAVRTGGFVEAELNDLQGRTFWFAAVQPAGEVYVNLYGRDVTERKRVEEELRHNREWLRVTLTSIGDAVIVGDTDGRVTFLNPAAASLTGWTEKDALGQPVAQVFDIINEQTREPGDDLCARVLRERRIVALANHSALVTRDGREIPVEDSAAPILDAAGEVAGVVLVFHDVTEKRRAQHALRESEERVRRKLKSVLSPEGDLGVLELADLIDASALQTLMDDFHAVTRVPMSIIDIEGRVLVGVGWQDICTRFHRAHPETCLHCVESDTQLSSGLARGECRLYKCKNNLWDMATPILVGGRHVGNVFSGQFFFEDETVDREYFRVQARKYGFDEEEYLASLDRVPRLSRETVERGVAFLVKLADTLSQLGYSNVKLARLLAERDRLTESLREHEVRLNRAQEIAHLGSWELDLTKDELTWSDEVYRIFGLEPQEFGATYEAFLERVHPDDRAAVNEAYSGSIREGRDIYEIEHRVVRKDSGEILYVHEKCEHFRDGTGQIVRSVGMVHDITERKLAEEGLKAAKISAERAKEGAEEASRAKDQFLAMLSHELRTPLTPVLAAISMLQRNSRLDAGTLDTLEMVRRNVELEARLIDDLLDLTRIARGKVELDKRPADLGTVIQRAVEVCAPDLQTRNLHFGVDASDGPYPLEADAARLQQVFWNLLKNAIKFTPVGGRVGIRCRRDNDTHVVAEVHDSGEGISPDVLPRLFKAFEQGDRGTTRQFGGLGLGLAISKAMVEMHGGTITARSAGPGRGATFSVRLPLAQSCIVPGETRVETVIAPQTRSLRILFVEDHGDTAALMRDLLEMEGHQVQIAGDVATALELASRHSFEALVSDLGLPDGSGIELMRRLRARGQNLPGIALSGYGQEQDIQQSRDAGFATHMIKPVSIVQLLEALDRIASSPE